MLKRLAVRTAIIAVVGGLAAATLVRLSPGFGLSEESLDFRRSSENLRRLQANDSTRQRASAYYATFLIRYLQGDLGASSLFRRPVRGLLAERAVPTAQILVCGLAGAWILALAFGIPGGLGLWPPLNRLTVTSALLLQSVPAAALGLCLLASGARGAPACAAALSLVLYPRLVQYVLNLVETAATAPHILTARAKGAKPIRILARHVMPATLPQLASLAGVSVGMAASAAIPLEAILDIAGLGQLAWQAALARDLNLLVNLTVLLTLLVTVANGLAELAQARAATSMERSV